MLHAPQQLHHAWLDETDNDWTPLLQPSAAVLQWLEAGGFEVASKPKISCFRLIANQLRVQHSDKRT